MPRPVIMLQDGAVDELMSVALLTTMPTADIDYLGCLVVNGDCLTPPTVSVTKKTSTLGSSAVQLPPVPQSVSVVQEPPRVAVAPEPTEMHLAS